MLLKSGFFVIGLGGATWDLPAAETSLGRPIPRKTKKPAMSTTAAIATAMTAGEMFCFMDVNLLWRTRDARRSQEDASGEEPGVHGARMERAPPMITGLLEPSYSDGHGPVNLPTFHPHG